MPALFDNLHVRNTTAPVLGYNEGQLDKTKEGLEMGKADRIRRKHEDELLNAPQKKKKNPKVGKIAGRVVLVVLCLAIVGGAAWGIAYTTGTVHRAFTAMTVGDQKISALEFDMYYHDTLSNVLYYYGQYGLDTSNIESQMYDENRTWADYIRDTVTTQLTEAYVLYSEAIASGYDYSTDEYAQAQYEAYHKQFETSASDAEMDLEEFVKAVYGNQMKLSDFESILERRFTYLGYQNQLKEGLTADDAEVEAFYEEHKDDYDDVSYRYFTVPYETVTYTEPAEGEEPAEGAPASEEEAEAQTEANRKAAEETANEMLSRIEDEQSFIELAREYASEEDKEKYEEDDATLVTNGSASSTSPLAEWYKDAARVKGDTAVIDNENNGYTVMYYLSRERDASPTVDVRHILLGTETAAEDATDEEKAAIETANADQKALAETVYEEWKNGDQTEESFAELAREYSKDSNAAAGGIYENVTEGEMVTEFNDWIFDPARKPGDNAIVETSYGYHIMYFVGDGLPAWEAQARTDLLDQKYQETYDALAEKYDVSTHEFAMNL